jgi:hypothetical protein
VRARAAFAACALAAVGAVGSAAWRLPGVFRAADSAATQVEGLVPAERTLLPARSFDLGSDLYIAAANYLPPGTTYYFATGPASNPSSSIVLVKAPVFAGYWLLPRRLVSDPDDAAWIVSYGGNLDELGLRYKRVVEVLPGFSLAEVQR